MRRLPLMSPSFFWVRQVRGTFDVDIRHFLLVQLAVDICQFGWQELIRPHAHSPPLSSVFSGPEVWLHCTAMEQCQSPSHNGHDLPPDVRRSAETRRTKAGRDEWCRARRRSTVMNALRCRCCRHWLQPWRWQRSSRTLQWMEISLTVFWHCWGLRSCRNSVTLLFSLSYSTSTSPGIPRWAAARFLRALATASLSRWQQSKMHM